MKNITFNFKGGVAAILLTLVFSIEQAAQQAIFHVPSTDILAKGKVYLEFDALFKTTNQSSLSRFSSFVPRVVVGVGRTSRSG